MSDALRKKVALVKTGILWSLVGLRFQNGGRAAILDPSPPCDQYPKDKQSGEVNSLKKSPAARRAENGGTIEPTSAARTRLPQKIVFRPLRDLFMALIIF